MTWKIVPPGRGRQKTRVGACHLGQVSSGERPSGAEGSHEPAQQSSLGIPRRDGVQSPTVELIDTDGRPRAFAPLGLHLVQQAARMHQLLVSVDDVLLFGSFPDESLVPVAQNHVLNGLAFERPKSLELSDIASGRPRVAGMFISLAERYQGD